MIRKTIISLIFSLGLAALQLGAQVQVRPRVAGLENNALYMSLLLQETQLRSREDSLNRAVAELRAKLSQDNANRERYGTEILKLENSIFDVRNNIGRIAGRTSAIEQEFIIQNLTSDKPAGEVSKTPGANSGKASADVSAYLTANPYFKEKLPEDDYLTLRRADLMETRLIEHLIAFDSNYGKLAKIAAEYASVDNSPSLADSLWRDYEKQKKTLGIISDSVSRINTYILDNKTYSYMLLLDGMNKTDVIARMNEESKRASDTQAGLAGKTESDAVSAYPIRKLLILGYEQTIADILGMNKALDSLKKAETAIAQIGFDYPKVELEEKLFLDFSPISIHSPSLYTQSNPIPQLQIHPKGTIYRVLLGSFSRPQPISIFRGAYPIGMMHSETGQYNYYAGGFPTQQQAEEAVVQMKKAGFKAPKPARWENGEYTLLTESNQPGISNSGDDLFSIDISGVKGDLPESVKAAIRDSASGKEISRIGENFAVGTFGAENEAEKLAAAIRNADSSLEVKVSRVSTSE